VVIENKPGAGGLVGTEMAANSAPDGYTLVMVSPSHTINPMLHADKKTYDPIKGFEPITVAANTHQMIVAHPSVPAKNTRELIAYAKANPGKLNYGSAGVGSATHLNMELFLTMAGINVVHVPYKGSTPALPDVIGGQVQVMVDNLVTAAPQIKAGRVRALAVTSPQRVPEFPDLPTIAESGYPGFDVTVWVGFMAPGKTPAPVIDTLNREISKILAQPHVKQRVAEMGGVTVPMSPAQFATFVRGEIDKWGVVVKQAGIKPD